MALLNKKIYRLFHIQIQNFAIALYKNLNDEFDKLNKNYQKQNFILIPFTSFKNWISSLIAKKENEIKGKDGKRFNPFELSKTSSDILGTIQGNIKCIYSRTTDVVTIQVTDQDPLVCALLADSIKEHLQIFITDYRTKKARVDFDHYNKLANDALNNYEKARDKYAAFSDASTNVSLKSIELKMQSMENDMQTKYNIYTAINTRREAAMAKVQENTPVFTELKNATVPVKPAGPKRMLFVAFMLILATMGTLFKVLRKEIIEWF